MRGLIKGLFIVCSSLLAHSSSAAIVVYDFTGDSGDQASSPPLFFDPQVIPLHVVRGSGLTAPSGANSFNTARWHDLTESDYVSFGFSVAAGFKARMTTLSFTSRSSNSGPGSLSLRTNQDGFTRDLITWAQSGTTDSNIIASLNALGDVTGATEFRIFSTSAVSASGGSVSSSGTWRLGTMSTLGSSNLLTIGGDVSPTSAVPEPASWLLMTVVGLGAVARKARRCGLTSAGGKEWDPYDVNAFYRAIQGFNIAAIFYGHTHVCNVFRWDGSSAQADSGINVFNADTGSHFSCANQALFYIECDDRQLTIREYQTNDRWQTGFFTPQQWTAPLTS